MRFSGLLRLPRRFYTELDYARHMPKEYVDRMKRHVPMREFDNRFGAPKLTVWKLRPEDHLELEVPARPWEQKRAMASHQRAHDHKMTHFSVKNFRTNYRTFTPQKPEEWTIFPGDLVQVMVGKDKGKQGVVSHIVREYNAVYVDGLHMKLYIEQNEYLQSRGVPRMRMYELQPLDPTKGQVKLVDPNDNEPCEAEWIVKDDTYVRKSKVSNYEIPLPSQAYVTHEYVNKQSYVESPKDTTADQALKFTYTNPQIKLFEQEIDEELGIKDDREKAPTFWY